MEKLADGQLDRNDVSTQILSKNYPPVLHGGMIQYIGHTRMQWELRKTCKPLFQRLWKADNVKTSFDGFCFMNGHRNYKKVENNSFLHSDQSPTKDFIWSYQGIMCLTDADENGGGYVCVPKSHLYHQKYFKKKGLANHKGNWYVVPEEDKVQLPLSGDVKINTKAGDFILFDSRTFHCNTKPTTKTLRVCTYICMLPADRVPEKVMENRMKAIKEKRTCCHHPGDGFKMFPKYPRYLNDAENFKNNMEEVMDFKLDEEMIEMI